MWQMISEASLFEIKDRIRNRSVLTGGASRVDPPQKLAFLPFCICKRLLATVAGYHMFHTGLLQTEPAAWYTNKHEAFPVCACKRVKARHHCSHVGIHR